MLWGKGQGLIWLTFSYPEYPALTQVIRDMHYYKFNIATWALHTSHLSLEEEAVYFRLVNHYYDSEQPIPLETQSVIRRLRLASHSDIVASILDEFFTKTDKGFLHNRCEELLKEYRKTVTKNRKNAAKGGRPRKNAASSETQSVSSGIPEVSQENPTGIPNQELLTNNYKPLTTNKELEKPKAKRFVPPELNEVMAYMFERTNNQNQSANEAQRFFDYYTANGWKVGRNKMVDWKATARNWLSRNVQPQNRLTAVQRTINNIQDLELD